MLQLPASQLDEFQRLLQQAAVRTQPGLAPLPASRTSSAAHPSTRPAGQASAAKQARAQLVQPSKGPKQAGQASAAKRARAKLVQPSKRSKQPAGQSAPYSYALPKLLKSRNGTMGFTRGYKKVTGRSRFIVGFSPGNQALPNLIALLKPLWLLTSSC